MSKRTRAVASLIFVMLVWGSSFSVTRQVVAELPPVYFAFLRFCVASLVLLIFFLGRKRKTPTRTPPATVIPMALAGVTFYYIFFNYSLRYTLAATGALLEGFIPVFILVLAAVFLKEKPGRKSLLGILISVAGVIPVGFVQIQGPDTPQLFLGNILMIICIILWAVYTILSKTVAAYDPLLIITYTTVIGTVFLLPAVLIELNGSNWPLPSTYGWLAIVYLGAIGSSLCYYLYSKSMEVLSAAQVGNFLNLDPLTGAAIAVIFLHENVSLWQLAGGAFILCGVWLSTKANQKTC